MKERDTWNNGLPVIRKAVSFTKISTTVPKNVIIFKYRAKGVRYAHYHADTKGGAVRV